MCRMNCEADILCFQKNILFWFVTPQVAKLGVSQLIIKKCSAEFLGSENENCILLKTELECKIVSHLEPNYHVMANFLILSVLRFNYLRQLFMKTTPNN